MVSTPLMTKDDIMFHQTHCARQIGGSGAHDFSKKHNAEEWSKAFRFVQLLNYEINTWLKWNVIDVLMFVGWRRLMSYSERSVYREYTRIFDVPLCLTVDYVTCSARKLILLTRRLARCRWRNMCILAVLHFDLQGKLGDVELLRSHVLNMVSDGVKKWAYYAEVLNIQEGVLEDQVGKVVCKMRIDRCKLPSNVQLLEACTCRCGSAVFARNCNN